MKRTIELHGVPMDLGANLRGVDMGPSALRIAGIGRALRELGHDVIDCGEVAIESRVHLDSGQGDAKYLGPIVDACERLATIAEEAMKKAHIPIFMGGDHSLAVGTVSGVARHYRAQSQRVGVIWFDAHADMNTPDSSPSGNVHGMPLSALLGYGPEELCTVGGFREKIRPENVVIVGARDVDPRERTLVVESGVTCYSMKEIDQLGIAEVTRLAIQKASAGTDGIHLSFDIDGLDPEVAPGVGTPVRGGVSFREAHLFLELISDSQDLVAIDVVELNPVRDDRNQSAEAVVHLLQSAFGRRIV